MRRSFSDEKIPRGAVLNWLYKTFRDVQTVESDNKIVFKKPSDDILMVYFKDLNILRVSKKHIWNVIKNGLRMEQYETKLIIRAFAIDELKLKNF